MLYAVIMAGGSGTRFWPESRQASPKQFLRLVDDRTMIRATVDRILPLTPAERIMVVTNVRQKDEVAAELPELTEHMLVAEPQGRNTAPCVGLAAYKLAKEDPDAVMMVLPADHVIGDEERFRQVLAMAAKFARDIDKLITFGIVPDRPETGYGYVEQGDEVTECGAGIMYDVKRFVEKPDETKAREYVASGKYLWNSGMFVWKASAIIQEFEKHLPRMSDGLKTISPVLNTPDEDAAVRDFYAGVESVSIDFGIMEKAENVSVMPLDVAWNDVGSWNSLDQLWDSDAEGNAGRGEFVGISSANCVVSSPSRLTVLIGVEDLVVVDTPDALLICRKDRAQDVKQVQEILTARGYDTLL